MKSASTGSLVRFSLLSGFTGGTFLKKKTDTAGTSASASMAEVKPCSQTEDSSSDAVEDKKTDLE